MQRVDSLEKTLMLGKTEGKRRGQQRIRWLDSINEFQQNSRHEFGQTPGDSGGQRSLACCTPWGCKELAMTERLN